MAVASEEDGGLGTFAALEADDRFDACLIPEPTGLDVVCAQAGSLTFEGVVAGRGAHAAMRLEGESAIDRYVEVHQALAAHERELNGGVRRPADGGAGAALPRVGGPGGRGRVGQLGARPGGVLRPARRARRRGPRGAPATGSGSALAGLPVELRVHAAACSRRRRPIPATRSRGWRWTSFPGSRAVGVPWGADMRLFAARGIPTVMAGPGNAHLAHAVDERVPIADLVATAEGIARVIEGFPATIAATWMRALSPSA